MMAHPNITPAQILAIIGFAADQAVAAGFLSPGREQFVLQIAGIVLPGLLMLGDAIIRHGRSKISVAMIEAEAEKVLQAVEHRHTTPAPAAK